MKDEIRDAIKKYQCCGCVCGTAIDHCFEKSNTLACDRHCAGTRILGLGKIFLGMPKGFSRLGLDDRMSIWIYQDVKNFKYDKFNIPVWKHKNKEGHIFVRGFMPRMNTGFLQVFLAGDFNSIPAPTEITEDDMKEMD